MQAVTAPLLRSCTVAALLLVFALLGSISHTMQQQRPIWLDDQLQLAWLVQVDLAGTPASISHNIWQGLSTLDHGELRRIPFQSLNGQIQRDAGGTIVGTQVQLVRPGFFQALWVDLASGRDFTQTDRTSTPVTVVHPRLLRELGLDESDALGKLVSINGKHFEIIGVTRPDFRGLPQREPALAWLPFEHYAIDELDVGLFLTEHQYALVYPRHWDASRLSATKLAATPT